MVNPDITPGSYQPGIVLQKKENKRPRNSELWFLLLCIPTLVFKDAPSQLPYFLDEGENFISICPLTPSETNCHMSRKSEYTIKVPDCKEQTFKQDRLKVAHEYDKHQHPIATGSLPTSGCTTRETCSRRKRRATKRCDIRLDAVLG